MWEERVRLWDNLSVYYQTSDSPWPPCLHEQMKWEWDYGMYPYSTVYLGSDTVRVNISNNWWHVSHKGMMLGEEIGLTLRHAGTLYLENVSLRPNLDGRLLGFSSSSSSTRTKAFTESYSTQTCTYIALAFVPCILISQYIREHRRAETNGEHHAGIIMQPWLDTPTPMTHKVGQMLYPVSHIPLSPSVATSLVCLQLVE